MLYSTLAIAAALGALTAAQEDATGKLGDAIENLNNPPATVYEAVFHQEKSLVRGSVVASSVGPGLPVQIQVNIAGLPTEGGPFLYHVHDQPVPADGNCTKTLAHLDPFIRGESPACDPTKPANCQVGDLSGKHGTINGQLFSANYPDVYLSLVPGVGDFIGNRSIVFHYANKTRITCANFVRLTPDIPKDLARINEICSSAAAPLGPAATSGSVPISASGTGTVLPGVLPTRAAGAGGATGGNVNSSTPSGTPTPTSTGPVSGFTGAAVRNRIGGAVVAIAMAAALL